MLILSKKNNKTPAKSGCYTEDSIPKGRTLSDFNLIVYQQMYDNNNSIFIFPVIAATEIHNP